MVLVAKTKELEAAKDPDSLYWIPPTGEPGAVAVVEVMYRLPLTSKRFVMVAVVPETLVAMMRAVSIEVPAVIRVEETFVIVAPGVSKEVDKVSRVPEAFVKVRVSIVEEGVRSSVEDAMP